MKKIGIIGGLSPESTISYYDGIIDAFRPSYESSGFPEILINSLDLKHFTHLAQTGNWSAITKEIALRCERLKEQVPILGQLHPILLIKSLIT
jgi:aspartate racemase